MIVKKIGAPIACTIKALSNDIIAMPITIDAVQSAQPINAWTRIVKIFLIFIAFSFCSTFYIARKVA